MAKRRVFWFLLLVAFFSAGTTNKSSSLLQGNWKSLGCGKVLQIHNDRFSFFDITSISCLPARQGPVSEFGNDIQVQNDTLSIVQGTLTYYYTRINKIPRLCTVALSEKQRSDPLYNFEVWANTVLEHYAYFELNGVNWDSLYSAQKNKLTSQSTDVELYSVLDETLQLLHDNHGSIVPTDEVYEQAHKLKPASQEIKPLKEYGDFEIAQMVAQHYLDKELTRDSWLIQWGKMRNNVGYIQVKAMWLYANLNLSDSVVKQKGLATAYADKMATYNEGEYIKKEVQGVSRTMDKVLNDLRETNYIILDIRFNGGGQDAVSMEILRRFNDKRIQVATQKFRFEKGYTPERPIVLEAADHAYTKSVYLLTSQQTASAADLFSLASLELPHFKRIGARTNGALSTALEKSLPNRWYFSLSNEVYEDNKGMCYENVGIPVDIELSYPKDRQAFFRWVADHLEEDKQHVTNAIKKLRTE